MSDAPDRESRTEEPTEKRLRDAQDEGRIPVSREVALVFSLAAIAIALKLSLFDVLATLKFGLGIYIDRADAVSLASAADLKLLLYHAGRRDFLVIVPVLGLLALAGIVAALVQHAPRFVPARIKPKFSNISPAAGFRRLYSVNGAIEFAKAAGKLVLCGVAIGFALKGAPQRLLDGLAMRPEAFGATLSALVDDVVTATLVVTIAIAAADLAWTRLRHRRDLRMTRQEIKQELKEAEGDPLLKARMKSIARDRSRRKMLQAVPSATMVITNPTHYAIALRYRRGQDQAPVVVAKGLDHLAMKIRSLAGTHAVRQFENPPLARALYKEAPLGHAIPEQFFEAVAALVILADRHAKPAPTE